MAMADRSEQPTALVAPLAPRSSWLATPRPAAEAAYAAAHELSPRVSVPARPRRRKIATVPVQGSAALYMPGLRPGANSFGADAYARQRPVQQRRQQLLPQPPQPQQQDKQGKQGKQQQQSPPARPSPRPARGDVAHDAVDSGSDRHNDDNLLELVDAGKRLPPHKPWDRRPRFRPPARPERVADVLPPGLPPPARLALFRHRVDRDCF